MQEPQFDNFYKIVDHINSFKLCGHSTFEPQGVKFNATADSVAFTVNCEGSVALNFVVLNLKTKEGFGMYFTVYVDGERNPQRFHINETGTVQLVVAKGLQSGEHTIEVYRQTEPAHGGEVFLSSVHLNGTLGLKPADKKLYIEFIGDSITAGYGSVADLYSFNVKVGNAPGMQDGTNTYAFLSAKNVNADICVTAWSGIGMVRGFEPAGANNIKITMPQIYDYYPDRTLSVKFEHTRMPNIYVINLGTNDLWNSVSITDYVDALKHFIAKLRGDNPKAKIALVGGMMETALNDTLVNIAKEFGGENAGFYSLVVGYKSVAHPISSEHAIYVSPMTDLIKKMIG